MQIQKRDIALSIVLTVITCGIYGLYWMYKLTNEIHALSGKPRTVDGGTAVLYTLLTFTIYFYYWLYKIGEELVELRRMNGLPDDSVSNETYRLTTIIMTIVSIFFMTMGYAWQIVLTIFAEAAPMHSALSRNDDVFFAIFFMGIVLIIVFFWIVFIQSALSCGVLWAVYERKDRNPTLVYLLMALLRTYGFTISFLQLSLNDFLLQRRNVIPAFPTEFIHTQTDSPVSLQKPLT